MLRWGHMSSVRGVWRTIGVTKARGGIAVSRKLQAT
jgi:hypothetical protein